MPKSPSYIADHLRRVLVNGASAPHTEDAQRFFREEVKKRGWRTAELRTVARRFTKVIRGQEGTAYLVEVAKELFRGRGGTNESVPGITSGVTQEEKLLAVLLLQPCVADFTDEHWPGFDEWLEHANTQAVADELAKAILGPMLTANPSRAKSVATWASSPNPWQRRAAAMALLHGTKRGLLWDEVQQLTNQLLEDPDDTVQKAVANLLREASRYEAPRTVDFLMTIRERAPRGLLRTACAGLSVDERGRVLGR